MIQLTLLHFLSTSGSLPIVIEKDSPKSFQNRHRSLELVKEFRSILPKY